MRRFENQHYIFTKGKIYPNDWLQSRPYTVTDATDQYYVSLANRVAVALRNSVMEDAFLDDHHILVSAIILTEWFEDICSGTRIWETVNQECMKRYGALLPFYDMYDYVPGEVNRQDLRLLIWDIVQTARYSEGRIINPENPGIAELAETLFHIFDAEFEYAPENERLRDYIFAPSVRKDLWDMRDWMNWFTYRCYVNHDAQNCLMEQLEDDKDYEDAVLYGLFALNSLSHRKNLLSLTSPQWAARIRKDPFFEKISLVKSRPYLLLKNALEGLYVMDMVEDKEVLIDAYSLTPGDQEKKIYREGESVLLCSLLRIGDKHSLCGSMTILSHKEKKVEEFVQEKKKEHRLMSTQDVVYKEFLKVNGDDDLYIAADEHEVLRFYSEKLGFKMDETGLPEILRGRHNILLFADPQNGIQLVPEIGRCIKRPGNASYDQRYAEKNASLPFFSSEGLSYRLSCRLRDQNLLPDAFMNSIRGVDYGRAFLHRNGDFFTDYYFSCCREYDFDPYYR